MFNKLAYIVKLYKLHKDIIKRHKVIKFINSLYNKKSQQYNWYLLDSFAKKILGNIDLKEYIKTHSMIDIPSNNKLDIYRLNNCCRKNNDIYFCNISKIPCIFILEDNTITIYFGQYKIDNNNLLFTINKYENERILEDLYISLKK